ncbi:hypothetical protein [Halomontanus rarus]|uniref:hypothetical protein n=1 Tax=Halomontanus rarus TaxID=3034020 RepID=UPI00307BFD8A
MTDAGFEVRWTPACGPPRAVVFEPSETDWRRTEFEWTDEEWREVGCERVTEVACFGGDGECVAPDGPRPLPAGSDGESDA